MLDDKFFDEENKKIITERMEKSIETLKELAKGTGNRIMFGFFVFFPLIQVMVIRHNTEVFTWWSAVLITPLFVMGAASSIYFTLLQDSKSRLSQKEWLSLGVKVDLLKAITWSSVIVFLGIMDDVPARTFYVFGGILLVGVVFVLMELQQFRFFLYYIEEMAERKKKIVGKD